MEIAALIGAGITAGALLYNQWKEKKNYDRELRDARENWEKQNAYNSPSAQMNRLKSAGLSPNLIYQNGGAFSPASDIASPSYQNTPLSDSLSENVMQMAYQNDSLQAGIDNTKAMTDKTKAETLNIMADNKVKDTPLGLMSEMSLMTKEEKDYYASLFGVPSDQMDSLSIRGLQYATQLKSMADDNRITKQERYNLEQVNAILRNNVSASESEAVRASLAMYLDSINLTHTAYKMGFSGSGSLPLAELKYSPELDRVLKLFIDQAKEAHWQASDTKHVFDTFNQTIGSVSGAYNSFKPTKQVKGVFEDFDFNYNKSRGRKSTYYQY